MDLDFSKCKTPADVQRIMKANADFFKGLAQERIALEAPRVGGGVIVTCSCGEAQCTLYRNDLGNTLGSCSACGKTMWRGRADSGYMMELISRLKQENAELKMRLSSPLKIKKTGP